MDGSCVPRHDNSIALSADFKSYPNPTNVAVNSMSDIDIMAWGVVYVVWSVEVVECGGGGV